MESRTIPIESDSLVDLNVRSDVAVIFCQDPRIRSCHKLLIRQGLGLGEKDEEYVQLPVLGGGAVLAHPQYFASEFDLIRTSLEVMREHFGVSRLVSIGHERCLRMSNFHLQIDREPNPDSALADMLTVRRMFEERSALSQCPVRKMFAEFEIRLDVILMKFPTGNELKYLVID